MIDQLVHQVITLVVVGFILIGASFIAPLLIKHSGRKSGGRQSSETSGKKG